MMYIAAVLFALAVAVMGLDLAGVRWAHGGGVTGNILLVIALVLFVVKDIRILRHHH
jgi:hypothetical protein